MTNKKLSEIRLLMDQEGLDALVIPVNDPHMGEYVPEHWRIIEWLTGFTGSAATVVITPDFAGLWTDSRYFIQGEEQLKGSGFTLVKLKIAHTPEFISWMGSNLPSGARIGFDGRLISTYLFRRMRADLKSINPTFDHTSDFVVRLWHDRPPLPDKKAFDHDIKYAGISREEKIALVRKKMKEINTDLHLLTSPEDIMWLLNIRGGDVAYSPLLQCYALISVEEVMLFADKKKVPDNLRQDMERAGVRLFPYDHITEILKATDRRGTLLFNPLTTSVQLFKSFGKEITLVEDISLPTRIKSVKNSTEIGCVKSAMIKDGVALTRFFMWLEKTYKGGTVTEISASDKLEEFRSEQEGFLSPSFGTISAVNAHAALPHYTPSPQTDVELEEGIYLLDSGGQYLDGTTDITRTIALSEPTKMQKHDFTRALKGMIGLSMVKFPLGTKGYQVEVLARMHLWEAGLNYGHGTGHGVGFCLNVHEGPQTIGSAATGDPKVFLEPGMLMSVEPAVYRDGKYGFRTENLVFCAKDSESDYGTFLKFDTVTLCYIDTSLIDFSLLDEKEKRWLNDYHGIVYRLLSPFLTKEECIFLENKTAPL